MLMRAAAWLRVGQVPQADHARLQGSCPGIKVKVKMLSMPLYYDMTAFAASHDDRLPAG